jgi:hypothetical protein
MLYAWKGAPSSPVIERERRREREKQKERERERNRRREREREMQNMSRIVFLIFKRNEGCLGTFQLSSVI